MQAAAAKDAMALSRAVFAPHQARSFVGLPDAGEATALLAQLAGGECCYTPVGLDKPIALYGAGDLGGLARDFLGFVGVPLARVIDRNADKLSSDAGWRGIAVVRPDAVTSADKQDLRIAVSIVTMPYVPIERALRECGFADIVPFYDLAESFRHLHPLSNGWFAPALDVASCEATAAVLRSWHDNVSRAHHLQFLAWRRVREEWTFASAQVLRGPRFFIAEVRDVLRQDESFVDAGAYHGGVTENFLRIVDGRCRSILAIEPDPASRSVLQAALRRLVPTAGRAEVLDCALAENGGTAVFHDGLGYASQLSETGRMPVAARALDSLGVAPTFVKLHLEGGELAALKGACGVLQACRPLVAATVYHNDDGIWRTPLWLMEHLPGYRFLFRLDSWCGTGGVVYGIPEERYGE